MVRVSQVRISQKRLKESLDFVNDTDQVTLVWLGQAGFAFRYGNHVVLIDPYLSDYLAKKYKNTEFSYRRLMPPPVRPEELRNLDLVLCTHRHSDHMDPETLAVLVKYNPSCLFIVPRAEHDWAVHIGLPQNRIRTMNAGEVFPFDVDLRIEAVASAHEELKVNEKGEHHFLGYVLQLGKIKIYHSGDCVPYPGSDDRLKKCGIDVALLPINGRDEYRRVRKIPGNFNFSEAVELCRKCNIPVMIAHHFGMFDLNTVDVKEIKEMITNLQDGPECILPRTDLAFLMSG